METEHRSMPRWERLRRTNERKEFLAAKSGPWGREEHDGAGDDLETRGPLARGWRRLQAVSMLVFGGRADKTEMEPLFQPAKSENDDSLVAAETDLGANRPQPKIELPRQPANAGSEHNLLATSQTDLGADHPQPRTTAKVQALLSPRHAAKLTTNNVVPEVVMDVHALLSPRRAAKLTNNNVPEVVIDVASNHPRSTETVEVVAVHVPTIDQMKKEQQGRCLKYSQKALGFSVCTFIGFASASTTENITFKLAIAPFFVAICSDLYSLKTKAKLGSALVFLSSFHLVLMIYIVFISFNMHYTYAIPFLPLVVGASLLQQKLWPEGQQQSTDEKVSKDLDRIFELSSLILNWSTFVSAIMAIYRRAHPTSDEPDDKLITFTALGFLFFLTIVLGLYLMLVTTVRTAALNLRVKYLDVLLIFLLMGTLIAALIHFT